MNICTPSFTPISTNYLAQPHFHYQLPSILECQFVSNRYSWTVHFYENIAQASRSENLTPPFACCCCFTIFAFFLLGFLIFIITFFLSLERGKRCGFWGYNHKTEKFPTPTIQFCFLHKPKKIFLHCHMLTSVQFLAEVFVILILV